MQPIEFAAPWGVQLKRASVFSVAVLGVVFCAGLFSLGAEASWFASSVLLMLPIAVLAGALPFVVRGYVLLDDALVVERLGWRTRLPLAGLESVGGDVEAMRGSIRLLGNGGLFSFTGEFWNRRLGRYRALATDPERAVVLRYPNRTIVITPHDPQHFIMRARTLMKHADFERPRAS
jgi:Bacterial PH domain